ncbi:hypothetical protein M427DRAFT_74767 [Gonapodya prolifera JEL478]|uniref:Microbial-type PARG catalytic domain-containing protein n=1 Tax=Gonapodya prolifera (strain JEL478) TaxID=1344416 RepID=A0A138ZZQ4_GONPJ|nr:hypothetical protein M427DRAFT_74767 [Gonapodya prolifera JEL478]|eukprot:KXS09984.1 hypothetical protein M427DRAFT_74767 [Gonapodya prolifera JEL478]
MLCCCAKDESGPLPSEDIEARLASRHAQTLSLEQYPTTTQAKVFAKLPQDVRKGTQDRFLGWMWVPKTQIAIRIVYLFGAIASFVLAILQFHEARSSKESASVTDWFALVVGGTIFTFPLSPSYPLPLLSRSSAMSRDTSAAVAHDTELSFRSLLTEHPVLADNVHATKYYNATPPRVPLLDADRKRPPIRVEVIRGDTLDVARQVINEGVEGNDPVRPLILNMASHKRPGGGWRTGARAQEEQLFYRSTYAMSLEDTLHLDTGRAWRYPLPPTAGVYSPGVLVFREGEGRRHAYLRPEERWWADFVAVAAMVRPPTLSDADRSYPPRERALTLAKIHTILRIALDNPENDALVLGAFGCGAFHNPPVAMAKLFKEALQDAEFSGRWKRVVFAVYDRKAPGNYEVFRDVLHGVEI